MITLTVLYNSKQIISKRKSKSTYVRRKFIEWIDEVTQNKTNMLKMYTNCIRSTYKYIGVVILFLKKRFLSTLCVCNNWLPIPNCRFFTINGKKQVHFFLLCWFQKTFPLKCCSSDTSITKENWNRTQYIMTHLITRSPCNKKTQHICPESWNQLQYMYCISAYYTVGLLAVTRTE